MLLPSPGDAGEARNRPGLLAHGGGWIGGMCPRGGGVGHMAPICARAQATKLWYRLTGVRLVRHTSVDRRRLLLGRVSVLCAAHVASPLFTLAAGVKGRSGSVKEWEFQR